MGWLFIELFVQISDQILVWFKTFLSLGQLCLKGRIHSFEVIHFDSLHFVLLFDLTHFPLLIIKSCLLLLNSLFWLLSQWCLQFKLLFQLFVFTLLLLDYAITLDDLLFALLKLFFHFLYLALVYIVRVCQLSALILQRCYETLTLLYKLFLVFELTLKALNKHHLLCNWLFLAKLSLI